MKRQKKKSIKARDMKPLKDVTGGRRRGRGFQGEGGGGFVERGDSQGLGPRNLPQ